MCKLTEFGFKLVDLPSPLREIYLNRSFHLFLLNENAHIQLYLLVLPVEYVFSNWSTSFEVYWFPISVKHLLEKYSGALSIFESCAILHESMQLLLSLKFVTQHNRIGSKCTFLRFFLYAYILSGLNNRFLLFDCFSVNAYLLSNESLEELNEFFWDFRPVIFRMKRFTISALFSKSHFYYHFRIMVNLIFKPY